MPKHALALIRDGVARAVVHDTRSAARAGTTSTGHALAPGGSAYGPAPSNLVLAGGDAADEAELMAPIERGLYVTRLWYLNIVHQKSTLVTGTTRDGTFLIEDGRIGRPLRDVRFTDSILRVLEATEALTADPATGRRGRLLRSALRHRRRDPGAARAGLQDHRPDAVSGSARHMAASAATGSGANWAPTRRSHSASASSRERAAE